MKRLAALIVAALGSVAALAQTAGMMSFQAVLKDGGGVPVIGAVTLELQIVDVGNVVLDANGDGVVNAADTFVVNTTAVEGVISVKYGPVAPTAFNGAQRFLKATVTNPPLPALTPIEIVTPPAIAEQINRRGSGTAAVVADATGNVGVGTAAPTATLDVAGFARFGTQSPGGVQLSNQGAFYSDVTLLTADGSDNKGLRIGGGGDVLATRGAFIELYGNESDAPGILTLNAGSVGDMRLRTANIDRVRIDGSGNVGIGTTTPDVRLHVVQPAGTSIMSESTSPGVDANLSLKNPSQHWNLRLEGASGRFELRDLPVGTRPLQVEATTPTGAIYVAASGNTGLGRVPGGHRLEVEGDAFKTAGTANWNVPSDRRIKTDIERISTALQTLDRVRVCSFRYRDEYRAVHPGIDDRRYFNVIAQEFAELFPDHVKGSGERLPDGGEVLQVDPWPLTIYSVAAIQELHAKHNSETAALKSEVSILRSENAAQNATIDELSRRLAQLEARGGVTSADGGR